MKKRKFNKERAKRQAIHSFLDRSLEQKYEFFESFLATVKHERVRDFIVTEPKGEIDSPSVIIHVPSGMWHGMSLTYEETLATLRGFPEADDELISFLFETNKRQK